MVGDGLAHQSPLGSRSRPPLNGDIVGQTSAGMEKDERLLAALKSLRDRFGDAIDVVDHWDADLRAVGISRQGTGGRLVYLSLVPGQQRLFDVALELPPASEAG